MNVFYDSMFKKMKRPEYWNFTPDQAYGANMVPGSEMVNPNKGRDSSNALAGGLNLPSLMQKYTSPYQGKVPGGNVGINTSSLPGVGNKSAGFSDLLRAAGNYGADYAASQLGKAGSSLLKDWFNKDTPAIKYLMETYKQGMPGDELSSMLGNTFTPQDYLMETYGKEALEKGGFEFAAPDPWAMAGALGPLGLEALTGSKTAGNGWGYFEDAS